MIGGFLGEGLEVLGGLPWGRDDVGNPVMPELDAFAASDPVGLHLLAALEQLFRFALRMLPAEAGVGLARGNAVNRP
ncbi:hypothetical protein D9M73_260150 [compost metagenome]